MRNVVIRRKVKETEQVTAAQWKERHDNCLLTIANYVQQIKDRDVWTRTCESMIAQFEKAPPVSVQTLAKENEKLTKENSDQRDTIAAAHKVIQNQREDNQSLHQRLMDAYK